MPIRADLQHYYGLEWETVIRPAVLKAAGYKCEQCRKLRHAWIFTYTWKTRDLEFNSQWRYHMIWIKEGSKVWRNQWGHPCSPYAAKGLPRKIRVRLNAAHVDHNPANTSRFNLRAWCDWCHLHHDKPHHEESRQCRKDLERVIIHDLHTAG